MKKAVHKRKVNVFYAIIIEGLEMADEILFML